MFEFAVDNGYLEYNPAYSIKLDKILPKHIEQHMEAITDENQLKKLYKTILEIDNHITSKILQFEALIQLRNDNMRNLQWNIDWDKKIIIFPKESIKAAHSDFKAASYRYFAGNS